MSAYKLSDEQYQMIADWLYEEAISKEGHHYYTTRTFLGLGYGANDEASRIAVKNRVRELYNLNRIALTTRYGEAYDRNDEAEFMPSIRGSGIKETDAVMTLKRLRYQCAEYISSETELFKKLDGFIGYLCENIFDRRNEG